MTDLGFTKTEQMLMDSLKSANAVIERLLAKVDDSSDEIARLVFRAETAEAALAFYGNPENYKMRGGADPDALCDGGHRARAALAKAGAE